MEWRLKGRDYKGTKIGDGDRDGVGVGRWRLRWNLYCCGVVAQLADLAWLLSPCGDNENAV